MSNQAEQAVLGALIKDGSKIDNDIIRNLSINDFASPNHKLIFKAMLDIDNAIDIVTVVSALKNTKVNYEYVTTLLENCPTAENINYYAKIVKEDSGKRTYEKLEQYLRDNKNVKTNVDLAEHIQRELDKLTADSNPDSTEHIGGVMEATFKELETIADSPDSVMGITTGFKELDKLLAGLQNGDLVIIAGRPGAGKSALVGNIAKHTSSKGLKTLMFSLEMSKKQLGLRYLSDISNVPMYTMKTGNNTKGDWEEISDGVGKHYDDPLWINDTPALKIAQIGAKCRQHKREYGLDIIIVDYLQLIVGNGYSRENEISQISQSLKALAKDLDVPLVCLSQLSRKCDERSDPRPILSDLRESGAIEQDADIVMFVFRAELYRQFRCECPTDLTCTCGKRGTAEVIVEKQRQGSTGTIDLIFDKEISKFKDAPKKEG